MQRIVVIGDVHSEIALAVKALERLEDEHGPIDQVFSVGDFGLFCDEADWDWLTGPKKYRHPEKSKQIARAWKAWRWPLGMIAGNHEPFHHLRETGGAHYQGKLTYTDGGALHHAIEGLLVGGLSGIYHPEHLEFFNLPERNGACRHYERSWPGLVQACRDQKASPKRLTYFKQQELRKLLELGGSPQILLTHDWPVTPEGLEDLWDRRPEGELLKQLRPQLHFCGHHHRFHIQMIGQTKMVALNILSDCSASHRINPGWAAILNWDGEVLEAPEIWKGDE